jgi:hypothetical protein
MIRESVDIAWSEMATAVVLITIIIFLLWR